MMRPVPWVAALALAGCVGWSGGPEWPDDHRYVLLAPEGVAVARVVTTDAHCPPIVLDGRARLMSVRMPPQTIPLRPTRSDPALSKPSAFPVLTCEATLPAGTTTAEIGGKALPLPRADPQRIVVIGDTGCRINVSDNAFQDCDDPAYWPFERIAALAAATRPDLVIHVGDYHYRENACPATAPGCAGSPWGYGWDAWRADFFHPARTLLAAAPWIVLRGNHESCDRAGQGWWRFLDPRPVTAGQNCNAAVDDVTGDQQQVRILVQAQIDKRAQRRPRGSAHRLHRRPRVGRQSLHRAVEVDIGGVNESHADRKASPHCRTEPCVGRSRDLRLSR